jgi:hypothetical protein
MEGRGGDEFRLWWTTLAACRLPTMDFSLYVMARVLMWLVGAGVDFINPFQHGLSPDEEAQQPVPFDPARGDAVLAIGAVLGLLLGLLMGGMALFAIPLPHRGTLQIGNALGWGLSSGVILGGVTAIIHHAARTVAPERNALLAAIHAAIPAVAWGWFVSLLVPAAPALLIPLAAAAHAAIVALLLRRIIP